MARDARRFGPRELRVLEGAVPLAQELTGQHYGLPDDWFERTSHEVCTRRDLRPFEVLGPGHLAQIRRVHRLPVGAGVHTVPCPRLWAHYRICLQDHNLLRRLAADPALDLDDLLLLVLTHEYVHLVRFCRFDCPYEGGAAGRDEEERRVHRVVESIVRSGPRRLREAAERLFPAPAG